MNPNFNYNFFTIFPPDGNPIYNIFIFFPDFPVRPEKSVVKIIKVRVIKKRKLKRIIINLTKNNPSKILQTILKTNLEFYKDLENKNKNTK